MRRMALWLVCLGLATPAAADERILSFDSYITINADATLVVTETLRGLAAGVPGGLGAR